MKSLRRVIGTFLRHGFIVAALAFFIFPLVWALATSFKPASEYYSGNFLPSNPTLIHYFHTLVSNGATTNAQGTGTTTINVNLPAAVLHSVEATVGTTVVAILLALPFSYAIARLHFGGQRGFAMGVLSSRMVPSVTLVIPIFLLWRQVGLEDTVPGLIIIYAAANLPFAAWSLIGAIQAVPVDLEEAAWVDGASRFRAFVRILVPLALGGIAATMLLIMFLTWGEFLLASVLTNNNATTLPVALALFQGDGDQPVLWGDMSAAIVISAVPMIVIAMILQRRLIQGLTAGALK
jgi:ABC-type glycerol-3-phosphate transport system permease component